MKTAVVYFSYDGNCDFAAQRIGEQLNADIVRLQLKNGKKRSGFARYLWGGGMSVFKIKPALKPYNFDPAAYELIILGTPVWAGSPSPPMRTFLSRTKITGKKLALFICHAGGKKNAMEKLKALLAGNTIAAEADFTVPLGQNPNEMKLQLDDWVKKFSTSGKYNT